MSASSFLALDLSPLQTCLLLGLFSESIAFNETDAASFRFPRRRTPLPANRDDFFFFFSAGSARVAGWIMSLGALTPRPGVPILVMQPPEVTCQRRLFPRLLGNFVAVETPSDGQDEGEESL